MFKEDASGLAVKLVRRKQQDSLSKRKATGKKTRGRPAQKTPTRGMELQSDQKREKNSAATSGSATDLGSSRSENLASSSKRNNQKATPEAKKNQHPSKLQPTPKSNRTRRSTLAGALGNPISINAVEDTLQSSLLLIHLLIDVQAVMKRKFRNKTQA